MVLLHYMVVLWVSATATSYHILCLQSGLSRSHYNLLSEIKNILINAGHTVTFVTPFPEPNPPTNLRYIDISSVAHYWSEMDFTKLDFWKMDFVRSSALWRSSWVLNTTAMQDALVNTQFDAILSEWLFTDLDAGYAAVQNVPWIVLCGTLIHPEVQRLVDFTRDLAASPFLMTAFLPPMNFVTRLVNTFTYFRVTWKFDSRTEKEYNNIFAPIAKARGVSLPSFYDAVYNVSLLLLNSHPSYAPAIGLPPNSIEVGGYHIPDKVPPLPKDLQELLDASLKGVVYFSLGSIIRVDMLHNSTIEELIKVFKNMPQTILWKLDASINNVPKNVHIKSWMPQTSILAHPNVKVFITHSGLLSTIEAVKFGVPLIAVPSFVDQHTNSHNAVKAGYAIEVPFSPNMAGDIYDALQEILSNESYCRRAKEVSHLFNNRIVDPKKLILHYIELTINTKGAAHLRLSHDLEWYEIWMLDQIAFLLFLIYVTFIQLRKLKNYVTNRLAKIKFKIQ
ncbi:UDP-glucosyltransferase 2-like [Aricia agestis]|uniref:UDP-glucosyltransferase 2-like n=1 Tax=Aricia agestis TaxID=91739 RepID=UPI001C208805|nr:UDP-glucosyltransferase 2-like [Aricia agestis]